MEILGYIASLVMGLVLGVMGGGGSILTVPIMVYLFGIETMSATGYSLFIVGTTAAVGSGFYISRGDFDAKTGLLFALPSIVGVNLSRGLIIPRIPDVVVVISGFTLTKEILVMVTFTLLMIAAARSMIVTRKDCDAISMSPSVRWSLTAVLGLVVGLIAGFVGAGGGFLIIPALILFAGLTMRVAVGTSLLIIAAQSLLGFAGDVARGASVDWIFLGGVAFVAMIGIAIGSSFANRMDERRLTKSFGWFVLVMGTIILFEQIRHS